MINQPGPLSLSRAESAPIPRRVFVDPGVSRSYFCSEYGATIVSGMVANDETNTDNKRQRTTKSEPTLHLDSGASHKDFCSIGGEDR
jgi:hypothetical protein